MRIAILLCACLYGASGQYQYGSIIDAGSSGSRIYLFRWSARVFPALPPPISTPVELLFFSLRGVAGIDTPAGRAALPSLLEWARMQLLGLGISASDIGSIPLFLKATAGMRMLTDEARASAMAEVRALLAAGPFQFQPSWARTISGEEEGISGWISVNYLQGLLPGQASSSSSPPAPTLGALDLGGASTQITFVPPAGVDMLSSQFDIRLSLAAAVSVYTHSFLYMGQAEAIRRVNELVVLNASGQVGQTIPHPCFLSNTPSAFLGFNSTALGGLVTFSGTSNATRCREFVLPLMLRGAQCLTDPRVPFTPGVAYTSALGGASSSAAAAIPALPLINTNLSGSTCSVNGQYIPPLIPPSVFSASSPVKFVAFSGFSFVWEALGLRSDGALSDLTRNATIFCNSDWDAANATFPGARGAFLFNYCILSIFAETLLLKGYGINESTPGIVTVVSSRASPAVSWALGSMLYEANGLPFGVATAPCPAANTNAVGWLAGSLAISLVAIGALVLKLRALTRTSQQQYSVTVLNPLPK